MTVLSHVVHYAHLFHAGSDDTYGDSTRTGGTGTGRDQEYVNHPYLSLCSTRFLVSVSMLTIHDFQGMGSGRTSDQDRGGYGAGGDDYDQSSSNKNDSTAGKLMEKAGNLFGSDKLQERGAEKRRDAGGYGDSSNDNY